MRKIILFILFILELLVYINCDVKALSFNYICPNVLDSKVRVRIKFETNGGETLKDLNYCNDCGVESFTLPKPTREGYKFIGWYADNNFKNRINDVFVKNIDGKVISVIPDSVDCNINKVYTYLYAKWEVDNKCMNDIKIYFNTNSNDYIEPIELCSTCPKTDIKLKIPKRDGYVFLGWYAEKELKTQVNIEHNLSNDIYNKVVLKRDKPRKECLDNRFSTLYAKWIDEKNFEFLMVDEVDNKISLFNDLFNK